MGLIDWAASALPANGVRQGDYPNYTKVRLYFKNEVEKNGRYDVATHIAALLESDRELYYKNRALKCSCELAPERRPMAAASGRFYGALEAHGADRERMRVNMQYGTEFTPWAIEAYAMESEPAQLLGRLHKVTGWELFDEPLLKLAPLFEVAGFMAAIK